jgi:hypothetical protein
MSVYEVVSGRVLLNKRQQFFELHSNVLLPVMKRVGITPVLLLMTEVGRYGSFLDTYRYEDLSDYEAKTDALLASPEMEPYYERIGECVFGGIDVQLMRELPYAGEWS